MIVVSDTTAISNLLTIGQADLLLQLFGRVLIPPAVRNELLAWHSGLPGWLETIVVCDQERVAVYKTQVHYGEAEALALALQVSADWLLMDDADGRRLARAEGAPILGLMGVLLLAKKGGLITRVEPLMDQLRDRAGFFLSAPVRAEVLRLAGEPSNGE